MSWSTSVPATTAPDVYSKIKALELPEYSPPILQEALDQFEAAKAAAINVIQSGALGVGEDKHFVVGISGHANPGHDHVDGWSDDFISVSVYQPHIAAPEES